MKSYINRFHNLGGFTVSEHKRNFNILLTELGDSRAEDLEEFFDKLQPANLQEEIFRIKLLTAFNKYEDLLETLLRGNTIQCKIILNKVNLEAMFGNVSSERLVEKIFPNLSFISRRRIINKLSSIETFDGRMYYEAIVPRYGIEVAKPLLLRCTLEFLKTIVKETDIIFSQRELLQAHKAHPCFLEFYFKQRESKVKFSQFNKLGQYLSVHDVETFCKLLEFGMPKIGTKGLKNFLSFNKDEIIRNPKKFQDLLVREIIYRQLSQEEYIELLKNMFPKLPSDFMLDNELKRYLKIMPRKIIGGVVFQLFEESYGFSLPPNVEYISTKLLKRFSAEDRMKFNLGSNLVEMYDISKSIPMIKEQLKVSEDTLSLLIKFVETCKFNENPSEILNFLKYYWQFHKDEDVETDNIFIYRLFQRFSFDRMGEEYWVGLSEFMANLNTKHRWFRANVCFHEQYTQYKLSHSLDYKEECKLYLNYEPFWAAWRTLRKYAKDEREFILTLEELITETCEGEELVATRYHMLRDVVTWNKEHPENKISLYNYMHYPDMLQDCLVRRAIFCDTEDSNELQLQNELLEKFIVETPDSICNYFSLWILRRRPQFIIKYVAIFVKKVSKKRNAFIYELSKMQYTEVYRTVKNYCTTLLNDGSEDYDVICNAIKILSYEKNFVTYVGKFMGDSKIQPTILNCLKLNPDKLKSYEMLYENCNSTPCDLYGSSLFNIFYNLPENTLKAEIPQLLQTQVSMFRFGISVTTTLINLTYAHEILFKAWKDTTNELAKKFILRHIFKCLCSNSQYCGLFVGQLNPFEIHEFRSLVVLADLCKVPKSKSLQVIEALWKIDALDGEKNFKFEMIKYITPNNFDFCDNDVLMYRIIRYGFLNVHNKFVSETSSFVYNYLLHAKAEISKSRIKFVLDHLHSSFCANCTEKLNDVVHYFFNILIFNAILQTDKVKARTLVANVLDEINYFHVESLKVELKVKLEIALHYLDFELDGLEICLVAQQDELIARFGPIGGFSYRLLIKGFMCLLLETIRVSMDWILTLSQKLLATSKTLQVRMLIFELMTIHIPNFWYFKEQYALLLEEILRESTPVVDISLANHLRRPYLGELLNEFQ